MKKTEEQTTQWPKEKDRRTDNTMAKGKRQKNRQHNDQRKKTEEQTTQWPKEKDRRTDNTMTKGKKQKNRQHTMAKGKRTKRQTTIYKTYT
jgi:hypothetical protein